MPPCLHASIQITGTLLLILLFQNLRWFVVYLSLRCFLYFYSSLIPRIPQHPTRPRRCEHACMHAACMHITNSIRTCIPGIEAGVSRFYTIQRERSWELVFTAQIRSGQSSHTPRPTPPYPHLSFSLTPPSFPPSFPPAFTPSVPLSLHSSLHPSLPPSGRSHPPAAGEARGADGDEEGDGEQEHE